MITLEKILGALTGKENLYRCGRNFTAIEEALNNSGDVEAHNIDAAAHQDIRMQINESELSTIAANYNAINSIPTTAKRGKLNAKLKGLSAVNLVKNGNFVNGTTGWTGAGSIITANNNTLFVTANGSSNTPYVKTGTLIPSVVSSTKIYARSKLRVTNSVCSKLNFGVYYGNTGAPTTMVGSLSINSPSNGTWYDLSIIEEFKSTDNYWSHQNLLALAQHIYPDVSTANGKVMDVQNYIAVNLTALFGAGNEPDLATCDKLFGIYFDGLQGSTGVKVVSCGKNLFDINGATYYPRLGYALPDGFVKDGNTISTKNSNAAARFIAINFAVQVGKQYTITFSDSNMSVGIKQTNVQPTYWDGYGGFIESGIVITANSNYLQIYLESPSNGTLATLANLQLEVGSVATAYEQYKGTSVDYKTIDGKAITLHKLPNGVYDEVTEDGKYIKRVGEKTLVAGDITSINTGQSTCDFIVCTKNADDALINITTTSLMTSLQKAIEGFAPGSVYTNGVPYTHINYGTTQFGLAVTKGTYANLAAAQAALAGTKLIYQLATPQILDTNATPLIAEPSGQVSVIPTTSPQPSAEFRYPINLGAVVDGLIEGQKQHSELLINQNAINLDFDLRITALEP